MTMPNTVPFVMLLTLAGRRENKVNLRTHFATTPRLALGYISWLTGMDGTKTSWPPHGFQLKNVTQRDTSPGRDTKEHEEHKTTAKGKLTPNITTKRHIKTNNRLKM